MAKILIVEDDPNVAGFLSTILRGAGYLCASASTGAQARQLLDADPDIGLLLLDHNLGDASDTGLNFLQALRQSPSHQRLPVIVCSGDSRGTVVSGFLGQKVSDFIKKPFRPERLLGDVQRVLGAPGTPVAAPSA
ncbi:MAG TPA: response regulator [Opitutaceae bacterium]|nr:response regulator [Opitutaceae bacterium]